MISDLIVADFEKEPESGRLHSQFKAFEEQLIPDLTTELFADMYAQTIAYGLFAARATGDNKGRFSRRNAAYLIPRTNPFLRKLFNEIAGPELDDRIAWLVDFLAELLGHADMEAILRDFGRRTGKEEPVVHFYETFLGAYDPKTKVTRGIFYTPDPVVSYIVRSIDYLLKTRFDKAQGLADANVLILDPAVGTGTFLHHVVKEIHDWLVKQGQQGLWDGYVAERLLPRIFGFELLMAPYAVAHLKLGLLLQETGYRFEGDQRLGIYLTNALEEPREKYETLAGFGRFISEEGNEAAKIKREEPIMVVLGNPPYAKHSANKGRWIDGLLKGELPSGEKVPSYYEVDGKPLGERNPKWLQDDYVKFIRFGQWRIERTGGGILAFISNHGYLDNPTFRGMRQQLMHSFTDIYILDLHGNAYKQETTPDGSRDENVFDIQQGVGIGIFVKDPRKRGTACVQHADLWGVREHKYRQLLEKDIQTTKWTQLDPQSPFYLFIPQDIDLLPEYTRYWSVTEIFNVFASTVTTARNHFTIAYAPQTLITRVNDLRDKSTDDRVVRERYALRDVSYWNLNTARKQLGQLENIEDFVKPYCYRPFDFRFVFYHKAICERLRVEVMRHMKGDNLAFLTHRPHSPGDFTFAYCTRMIGDQCVAARKSAGGGNSFQFPLYLYPSNEGEDGQQKQLFDVSPWPLGRAGRVPNLNREFVSDLEDRLGLHFVTDGSGDLQTTFGPEDFFYYAYAVFHSPAYRTRYEEFLKTDFPRLPLTSDRRLFAALVEKGAELVALHLMESPALETPITSYPIRGSDKVEKVRYVKPHKEAGEEIPGRVYINKEQYFEVIAPEVWNFHIGGYQVLNKWLKDRRGRKLSIDDSEHYQRIVVALRETMRLMEEIDTLIPTWPLG